MFNEYFLQIPKILKECIGILPDDCCQKLNTLIQSEFDLNFRNTNREEVLEIISKLKVNKSSGHD